MSIQSLTLALQRFGRGLLGAGLVIGPILLITAYRQFERALYLLALAQVGIVYITAIWKCWHQGALFISKVVIDVIVMFLFMGATGVLMGIIASYGGPKLYENGVVPMLISLVGFWILESRKGRLSRLS